MSKAQCPNCHTIHEVKTEDIQTDYLGNYTVCKVCEASFDVEPITT